jgi:hypothetical protein
MPLRLNVPYHEKDAAKAKGAQWDEEDKTWFVPEDLCDHYIEFERWFPDAGIDLILTNEIIAAFTDVRCRGCGRITKVMAIGTDGIYTKQLYAIRWDWNYDIFFCYLYYIRQLDEEWEKKLRKVHSTFYKDFVPSHSASMWVNHCSHCQTKIMDDTLILKDPAIFRPKNRKGTEQISIGIIKVKYFTGCKASYGLEEDMHFVYSCLLDREEPREL